MRFNKKYEHPFKFMTGDKPQYLLLKNYARANRINMTVAETMLWDELRAYNKSLHFRRQHIIGTYIVDFVCLKAFLVIEVDGGYHAERKQEESDEIRTDYLNRMGYDVIRFTNEEVVSDTKNVVGEILSVIDSKMFEQE